MKKVLHAALGTAALAIGLAAAGQAGAVEIFAGYYGHGIGVAGRETDSDDAMFGARTQRVEWLKWIGKPQIHAMISINTKYSTDFVAAGFDWPIPLPYKFYIRPGIGLAYTTGRYDLPATNAPGLTPQQYLDRLYVYEHRIDFGDPVLFEPELALGYKIAPNWTIEASYVHLSNGQIFHQGKNQGLDDAGLRIAYRFR